MTNRLLPATGIAVTTAPSSDVDTSRQAHQGEARLLAALLRSARLALLIAEEGTDKATFLTSVFLPLLSRRTGDQFAPSAIRESGVVVPFPDRRKRPAGHGAKRKREFVVHFDDWSESPLLALLARIHQTANTCEAERDAPWQRLSDTLEALCTRLDASFIIVLDRFEDFVLAPSDRDGNAEFTNQWIEALHRPTLPVSFLIAVSEGACSRLGSLRSRIPGFDDFSLKLTRPPGDMAQSPPPAPPVPSPAVIEPPVLTEGVIAPESASTTASSTGVEPVASQGRLSSRIKVKQPAPPRTEVKAQDVYALIEATLARTVTEVSSDPFPEGEPAADSVPAVPIVSPPPPVAIDPRTLVRPQRPAGLLVRIARWLGLPFTSNRDR